MTTSHRGVRVVTLLSAMSLLLLGPVAFGASVSTADELAPDSAASAPMEAGVDEGVTAEDVATEDVTGESAGAGSGGPGSGGPGSGGPGSGGPGSGEEGDHGDEGTGEEGDHGEGSAVLVCLATDDPEAPYTAAMVMPTAIISGEGRVKKEGPANSPVGLPPAPDWGNIVPDVTHPSGATFAGLNWNEDGQAIWAKGCGPAVPPDDGHDDGEHGDHATVVVCIATEDSVTPYTLEYWMVQAIINGKGDVKKEGPANDPVSGVFPADVWGNIIPVVTHPNKKATYPGLNWDAAGQAIWEAGCEYVAPVTPAPTPGAAPAPADFCPNLDGVQWENYDCNTPQAVAAPAEPAVVVTSATAVVPELAPTPVDAAMPAEVSVPTEQTLPEAVDAGGTPPAPIVAPVWAILMLVAGSIGAAAGALRLALTESA